MPRTKNQNAPSPVEPTEEKTEPTETPGTGDSEGETVETVETVENFDTETAGDDGSRFLHADRIPAILTEWAKRAADGVTAYRKATRTEQAVAESRVAFRATIILESGYPDFAADSDTYKRGTRVAEAAIVEKMSKADRGAFNERVKKHVRRVFLLPGMVAFILEHEVNFGDEWTAFQDNPANVLGAPSDALKLRVWHHADVADLKLDTSRYPAFKRPTAPPSGGGNPPSDPENPLASFQGGLGTLEQVTPRYGVNGLLQLCSALSESLLEKRGGEIEDRPGIIATLARCSVIMTETAAGIATGDSPYDEKALKAALFNSKNDAIRD